MKLLKHSPDYYHYVNQLNTSFVNMMIEDNKFEFQDMDKLDIKIGLEFEFYLGDKTGEFEKFRESLQNLFQVALPIVIENIIFLPESCDKQKNKDFWYLERDDSLKDKNGYELVSPMLDIKAAKHYLTMISSFIEKLGYTTDDCGFHVHISSKELSSIKPSNMMLLLEQNDCLSKWEEREGYNKNILDFFKIVHPDIFDVEYGNLSKRYNLIPRFDETDIYKNHMEIRAFGGENYHLKTQEILDDLKMFVEKIYIPSTNELISQEIKSKKNLHIENNKDNFSMPITFKDIYENNMSTSLKKDEESKLLEIILELEKDRKFVPTCTIYNDYYNFCKEEIKQSIDLVSSYHVSNNLELNN